MNILPFIYAPYYYDIYMLSFFSVWNTKEDILKKCQG